MKDNNNNHSCSDHTTKGSVWGADLAGKAIAEMDELGATAKGVPGNCTDAHAKAFLDECNDKGRDPVEVVEHILEREGLPISCDPKDPEKKLVYSVLRAVIRMFVRETVEFLGTTGGKSMIRMFLSYIAGKFGKSILEGCCVDHHECGARTGCSSRCAGDKETGHGFCRVSYHLSDGTGAGYGYRW